MMHKPFAGMPAAGKTFEDVSVMTYIRTNDHIKTLKEKYQTEGMTFSTNDVLCGEFCEMHKADNF
jgi:hypothetical protein